MNSRDSVGQTGFEVLLLELFCDFKRHGSHCGSGQENLNLQEMAVFASRIII